MGGEKRGWGMGSGVWGDGKTGAAGGIRGTSGRFRRAPEASRCAPHSSRRASGRGLGAPDDVRGAEGFIGEAGDGVRRAHEGSGEAPEWVRGAEDSGKRLVRKSGAERLFGEKGCGPDFPVRSESAGRVAAKAGGGMAKARPTVRGCEAARLRGCVFLMRLNSLLSKKLPDGADEKRGQTGKMLRAGRVSVSCKADRRLRSERRRLGATGAFSLTPALSRWERENCRPRSAKRKRSGWRRAGEPAPSPSGRGVG